jgi:hypothetical protein
MNQLRVGGAEGWAGQRIGGRGSVYSLDVGMSLGYLMIAKMQRPGLIDGEGCRGVACLREGDAERMARLWKEGNSRSLLVRGAAERRGLIKRRGGVI